MCPGWTSIYFFTVPKFSDCGMLAAHHTVSFLSPQLDSFCFTIQSIKQIQETSKGAWNEPINNANKNITIFKRVEQHQNIVVTEHFSVIWTENQNWKKKKNNLHFLIAAILMISLACILPIIPTTGPNTPFSEQFVTVSTGGGSGNTQR